MLKFGLMLPWREQPQECRIPLFNTMFVVWWADKPRDIFKNLKPVSVTNPNDPRSEADCLDCNLRLVCQFVHKWNRKSNFRSQNPVLDWLKETLPKTNVIELIDDNITLHYISQIVVDYNLEEISSCREKITAVDYRESSFFSLIKRKTTYERPVK